MNRDTRDTTGFSQTATVCPPWRTVPKSRLTPLFEAASERQRCERPGLSGDLVPAGGLPRAAHRRSNRLDRSATYHLCTTKHLRTNGSGPEGHVARVATGPTDRTHLSNRKETH